MKHLSLFYLTAAISATAASAGTVDCRRRIAQKPLSTPDLSLNSTARLIAPAKNATTLSTVTASSTILTTTTLFTTTTSAPTTTAPVATIPSSPSPVKPTSPAAPVPIANYLPIFYDDFSGTPGTLPSSAEWIFDQGQTGWGNDEVETYTASTSNIQITSSSTLLITPLITSSGNWTSARIETQRDDFQCPPNRKLFVQASIKLGDEQASMQQGIWPAFWALGSAIRNGVNWPYVSEWDIMESVNGLDTSIMTIHCGTDPYGPCNEPNGISQSTSMSRGVWNTFGFEVDRTASSWQTETLNWYLNGQKAFTVNGAAVGNRDDWRMLAHEPHFLLFDLAVGGNFVDARSAVGNTPDKATAQGAGSGMEVDYVGVWISPQ